MAAHIILHKILHYSASYIFLEISPPPPTNASGPLRYDILNIIDHFRRNIITYNITYNIHTPKIFAISRAADMLWGYPNFSG